MLKIFKWILNIKEPYALYLVARDPRTKTSSKITTVLVVGLMIAYIISPLDIVPDTLPLLGWLDDLALVPIAIMIIEKIFPPDILVENRKKASLRVNRAILAVGLGLMAIFTLWAIIFTAAVLGILKFINS